MRHAGLEWHQPKNLTHLLALMNKLPNARIISGNSELAIDLKFRFIHIPVLINPKQVSHLLL
jgi:xanthine dehydrogenase/oxidase